MLKFSNEEWADILDTAAMGCAYWARTEVYLPHILSGGPCKVWDTEDGDLLGKLGINALKRGLRTLEAHTVEGKLPAHIYASMLSERAAMDASMADIVVQYALFGKLVYG